MEKISSSRIKKFMLGLYACLLCFSLSYSLLVCTSCSPVKKTIQVREGVIPEKGFDLIPKSEEIFYSQRVISDFEKDAKIIEDKISNKYLDELGKRIITRTRYRSLVDGYEWSFHIVDSGDINIFSLLGGRIYVSRDLINSAESESELASILAFEIGHVMARHLHQHLSQEAVVQGIIMPGEMIKGVSGLESLYQIFEAKDGVYHYFANLSYYSDEVGEADEYALNSLNDAGFNPRSLADIITRVFKDDRQRESALWLRRNPWDLERAKHLRALVGSFSPFLATEDNAIFLNLKAQLRALSPPPVKKEELSIPEYRAAQVVKVLGDAGWKDTGLDVSDGQEIYFKASGIISLQKGNPIAQCGPDGYDRKSIQQPLSDENIGALVGKIVQLISVEIDEETGEETRNEVVEYFFIGSENKVRMSMNGHLFLGINEDVVGDNSGEFEVMMYLRKITED